MSSYKGKRAYKPKNKSYYGPVAKRANVYGPAAMQLAKDVAYIASLVNSEPKYFTLEGTNNFTNNGIVLDLSLIPIGDGNNNRDGNSVLPRYLSIRCSMAKAIPGSLNHNQCRVMIFRYWGIETDGTPVQPVAADVLATVGSQLSPLTHLNDNNTGRRGDRERRIEVLRNEHVCFDNVSNTCTVYDWNIEMNGPSVRNKQHIKFQSASAQTAISGGIYALFISDSATATDVDFRISSKLTFYDN